MRPNEPQTTDVNARAGAVLEFLGLDAGDQRVRPVSGHNGSILLPCHNAQGQRFLLKYFVPPAEGRYYPPDIKLEDYARREGAFYRFLDSIDPERRLLPAPKTVLVDPGDPPSWILLEWIEPAVGPAEETLGTDHVFELLAKLRDVPLGMLIGRRDFPLNHWEVVACLDRVRMMYDDVIEVIGAPRWKRAKDVFTEALKWTESRPPVLVHGDFTEQNIMVDEDGRPFLVDFERIGIGHENHDFAWLWIHSERSQSFKRVLIERYFAGRVGSERIRAEWGIRATLVYLALRRLRFGALIDGAGDAHAAANLGLLDAALAGGADLFPA